MPIRSLSNTHRVNSVSLLGREEARVLLLLLLGGGGKETRGFQVWGFRSARFRFHEEAAGLFAQGRFEEAKAGPAKARSLPCPRLNISLSARQQ